MNPPETEILVHIAAPARAADDTKYRTLAAAYLNFEPVNRTSVFHSLLTAAQQESGGRRELPQTQDLPQSTPGVIQSPMLSFQSAANNFGSPRLQQPVGPDMLESQLSWRPPPSVIEDSMPDNEYALLQYCTPTRILEHYTSATHSTQLNTSPISQRRQGHMLPASSPPRESPSQRVATAISDHSSPLHEKQGTVIPGSPREAVKRPRQATPTSSAVVEETRIASSYPSQQDAPGALSRSESEPPLAKRPRTSQDPAPSKPMARSASDVGPQRKSKLPDTLEIISPPPPTSQRELRPEDMITDLLDSLAHKLDLNRRFNPQSQTRDLRPFERGYWLVDCSSWKPELKCDAWDFLTRYLGNGAAGWGTVCRRDPEFTYLRLYCWGCVVGHMYLLLYLASKREVRYTGARWIAGDGGAVVVVGARSESG